MKAGRGPTGAHYAVVARKELTVNPQIPDLLTYLLNVSSLPEADLPAVESFISKSQEFLRKNPPHHFDFNVIDSVGGLGITFQDGQQVSFVTAEAAVQRPLEYIPFIGQKGLVTNLIPSQFIPMGGGYPEVRP
jgi:hypothetical protein